MSIKEKKPMMKQSVGALYYSFNEMHENGDFNPSSYEEDVTKSNVVSEIGTTENDESTPVYASGEVYETVNDAPYVDMSVQVVAFDPKDLAKMRKEDINAESGLVLSGAPGKRPFFAFGKVVKKIGGGFRFEWFPKCQLIENTDDIATKKENFSEQNDTIKIRAYKFDDVGNKKAYVDSEIKIPEGLTEEKFFAKPILKVADLTSAITPGA